MHCPMMYEGSNGPEEHNIEIEDMDSFEVPLDDGISDLIAARKQLRFQVEVAIDVVAYVGGEFRFCNHVLSS